jgi:predicted RNA binding protein YcfA (HicA-like mRNA interferase family)
MNATIPEISPKERVIKALEELGYRIVRQGTHIALSYYTASGVQFPLTIPDQMAYNASTIRAILSRAGISKQDYLTAYQKV